MMVKKVLNLVVYIVEIIVAIMLVVLACLSLYALTTEIWHIITQQQLFKHDLFFNTVSTVLEVFIIVELFRIALAYMNHKNVIPTVLEAALVAIARKFVMFETPAGVQALYYGLALGILLIAVSLSWYLMTRTKAIAELVDIDELNFVDDRNEFTEIKQKIADQKRTKE